LPKDHLPPTSLRHDALRTILPAPIEDEVNCRASASSGQPSARWQYTLLVRGLTSRVFNTTPFGAGGTRIKYGSALARSGGAGDEEVIGHDRDTSSDG